MAEFQKVIKDRLRMCTTIKECENCPISQYNNGKDAVCQKYVVEYTDEAEKKIEDWAEKNPVMTNGMKAKEIFGHDLNVYCYADEEFWSTCDSYCTKCPYYRDTEYNSPEGSEK